MEKLLCAGQIFCKYKFHDIFIFPDEIKRLKRGEAFVVKKFPEFFVEKVQVGRV
jgi:ferredoxin